MRVVYPLPRTDNGCGDKTRTKRDWQQVSGPLQDDGLVGPKVKNRDLAAV